jgi:flagellin
MALIINHNMTAQNAARNLGTIYDRLSTSVQRLSSGLRINSAADDAAGLAVREMMRADIATMNQGIRNTADAISMIQTADGALSIIDEKLTRMKELAEQAATGTYTTAQREIINSEYQAMAAEIDRIANATNFNGIKLLDGSVTNQHGGQGIKIHFGVSNNASEDYYFVNIGDARATSSTGLRIGGDAKNDIWGQGAAGSGPLAGPGCCTAGYDSLNGTAGYTSGQTFSYGYNWTWTENTDSALLTGRYLAGRYTVGSSESLQDLIDKVNAGTQSRVGVVMSGTALATQIRSGGTLAVCVGDEAYIFGSAAAAGGTVTTPASAGSSGYIATGTFVPAGGLMYNTTNTIALTAAQRTALEALGVNVDGLNLNNSISITGRGSGITASGAAAALLGDIGAQLAALGLSNYNFISASALTAGVSAISATDAALDVTDVAALGGTSLTQQNAAGRILPNQRLEVHTGIYRDVTGNWTTESALANALGMTEIVYTINNENTSSNTYRTYINYTGTDFVSGNLRFTSAQYSALIAAGVNVAALNTHHATVNVSAGSNVSSAAATTAARAAASALFAAQLAGQTSAISLTAGTAALSVLAANWTTAIAGNNDGTNINSGASFTVNTGLWMDANGNYTSSQSIADRLGMAQLMVDYSNTGAASQTITVRAGSLFSQTLAGGSSLTVAAVTASVNTALTTVFAARQAGISSTTGGLLTYAAAAAAQTLPANAALTTAGALTTQTNSPLDVWVNGTHLTGAGAAGTNAFFSAASHSTVSNLVTAINTSLGQAFLGLGLNRLRLEPPPDLPNGPTSVALLSSYSNVAGIINATPETTVTTTGIIDSSKHATVVATNTTAVLNASGRSNFGAWALASAINNNANSQFWAMVQAFDSNGRTADMVYIFTKDGGDFNDILACDVAGEDSHSRAALNAVQFENTASTDIFESGTTFTLGGEHWATMKPTQTKSNLGNEVWNVTLNGRDVGAERDLWIANSGELTTPSLAAGIINGMDRNSFVEIQNAANGPWAGAHVRTQSYAQEALDAISNSIVAKDKIRADLGALQNRLENTMTNLTIQAENLQASESRISDVDVATEMTEFTRNNVLAQAATSMLAQANSLSQLALSLIR